MKLLFDFLPIALFFGMFRYADGHKDWAASLATDWLGMLVVGGVVSPAEAPVLLSTVVVILATLAQVLILLVRGKRIDAMLWVSLALVVVLGGATIYFHNENFIKWKPTALYWVMGSILAGGQLLFKRNLIKSLLGAQMELPENVWTVVCWSWVAFFAFMGCLNLWVAFNFSTATWVSFKMFGGLGLMLLFVVAQAAYLGRHLKAES